MKQLVLNLSRGALNIIFPISCQGCGVRLAYDSPYYLCKGCRSQIKINRPPFCLRCGRSLSGDREIRTVCPDCLGKNRCFERAWQCCEYDGLLKELIHGFKYKSKLFLKGLLSDIMSDFIKEHIGAEGVDAVAAVPMYHSDVTKRGFNQAALLSEGIGSTLNIIFLKDCLLKIRKTKEQIGLNKNERFANVRGAFCAKKDGDLHNRRLLLIDDVFTTGATVDECSKVLLKAGAKSVWTLALARGL